jgi:hypothetical protein
MCLCRNFLPNFTKKISSSVLENGVEILDEAPFQKSSYTWQEYLIKFEEIAHCLRYKYTTLLSQNKHETISEKLSSTTFTILSQKFGIGAPLT